MNNERLYRGKDKRSKKWIIGYYCPCSFGRFPCKPAIVEKEEMDRGCWQPVEVIPETVGQLTGITANGAEVFEGDICLCDRNISDHIDNQTYIVEFDPLRGWYGISKNGWSEFDGSAWEYAEVIGNLHDNPELLN